MSDHECCHHHEAPKEHQCCRTAKASTVEHECCQGEHHHQHAQAAHKPGECCGGQGKGHAHGHGHGACCHGGK